MPLELSSTWVISGVIAAATVYLQLFVGNRLGKMKAEILAAIGVQYVAKDLYESERDGIKDRLRKLETKSG